MEINKIKELHAKGIVPKSKMEMVKIIVRYKELCGKYKTKGDVYFQLEQEFCLSESRLKSIVSQNRHLL